jgi:hypothetical protein
MAQHDMNIANQGFPATRADLNNALQAIATNNSGTSAPSTTFANQWFYNTSTNKLFIRNEANSAFIEVATLDQTNNEWQITTGVIQAKDGDGLALKTDDGVVRLFIRDSDGNVGIGTNNPTHGALHIADGNSDIDMGTNAEGQLHIDGNGYGFGVALNTSGAQIYTNTASRDIIFGTDETERMRITDGNVGIGEATPNTLLHLKGTTPIIRLQDSDTNAYGQVSASSGDGNLFLMADEGNSVSASGIRFHIDGSHVGRFESTYFLVGMTSNSITGTGIGLVRDGTSHFYSGGTHTLEIGRGTNDGQILKFNRSGAAVGRIAVDGAGVYFGDSDTGIYCDGSQNAVLPANTNTPATSNAFLDLGNASARWDDIFADNGTINTSDEREKQDIASLSSAEITAATAISKLFKTYKWKKKVVEKGDAARTHSGVVAQEVEQAMTDAGLDASKYAFWCSDTWWSKDVEVAAVEADEERGIEAKDAFTKTVNYKTKEEAPEGATEQNVKGIRYPELLAFVGAATEQRLTSIEARLTALEG